MDTPIEYEAQIRQSPEFALRELSAHFDYNNAVWRTLQRLAKNLDEANIPYMLVGAMALNQHGYQRATTNVDLIMTAEGLAATQAMANPSRSRFHILMKPFC
jgi:hypothetical protein